MDWFRRCVPLAALFCCVLMVQQEAAGQAGWGPNRVSNASFEDQLDFWNPRIGARQEGAEVFSQVEIDAKVAYSGIYSLRLSGDTSTTRWLAIESEPIPATPGKRYRFGAFMKSEDVTQEEGQYHNANVYIQFRDNEGKVLDIAGSPVRGTQPLSGTRDWLNLFAFVVAPEGTAQARIGCALTCSGTMWFDDLTFQESEDVTWASKRTRNFAYFYAMDETPPDSALAENERLVERVLKILNEEPGEQIKFFKYKSTVDMGDVRSYDSTASAADEAVHSIRWNAPALTVSRIVAGRWGRTTGQLEEGLATFIADSLAETDYHAQARESVKAGTLPQLWDTPEEIIIDQVRGWARRNPVYGSFVGWLIEAQGIDQFKRVCTFESQQEAERELPKKFKNVYGMTPVEAEAEWHKFLRNE